MSTRFSSLCNHCGLRSAQGAVWPRCRVCTLYACPECQVPGTYAEDEDKMVICIFCRLVEMNLADLSRILRAYQAMNYGTQLHVMWAMINRSVDSRQLLRDLHGKESAFLDFLNELRTVGLDLMPKP